MERGYKICGYEAGCPGSLYHQLENFNVECVILAPTTINNEERKTDQNRQKRWRSLPDPWYKHYYSPHIPTETDNQTKEFIRMRDDHKRN